MVGGKLKRVGLANNLFELVDVFGAAVLETGKYVLRHKTVSEEDEERESLFASCCLSLSG